MAVWNFMRLSNQGHEMKFYSSSDRNKRLLDVEARWEEFAARVNAISNAGLDGLIDQFHQSAFMRGAQAAEVEVNSSRTDVVDVYPIIPQTVNWEYGVRNGRQTWIPYQQFMTKVYLDPGNANFFWVPTDPLIDDPRGVLILTPVIQAVDFQMQILQDMQAVLHHQGWPRNDIKILHERMAAMMPPHIRAEGPEKQAEWMDLQCQNISTALSNIEPDSDFIHYDDIEINMSQGASAGRGLDVRAISELIDTQTLSGAKQMAIFMNRNQGVTESWGSIQFRIFCSGIASIQRGSKRMVEEIARLWLRVQGIQAVPKFTHNTIDWESEEQRWKVKILQQQFNVVAQMMGWIDADTAASAAMNVDKAVSNTPSEAVRVSLSMGGDSLGSKDHVERGLQQNNLHIEERR
jgi:hypothetical protein